MCTGVSSPSTIPQGAGSRLQPWGQVAAGSMTAALQQSLQETSQGFQFCLNTAHTEQRGRELKKCREKTPQ